MFIYFAYRSVWGQDSYLLEFCQAPVHFQSISQGNGSGIFNSIPSKTGREYSRINVNREMKQCGHEMNYEVTVYLVLTQIS